jgi:hypothetical protein
MRHKDKATIAEALQAWKHLRRKVETEGGQHYDKPVLVQFLDRNTYEVMERDIVEDEFYVLRKYRILRDLDASGRDIEEAIRTARGGAPGPSQRAPRRGDKGKVKVKEQGGPRRRRRRRGPRRGAKPPS